MSQALPPGTIGATRSAESACADPIGPGMPGPPATCFSCPPGYQKVYRTWGVGARDGSWNCIPLPLEQGQGEQIATPARPGGTSPMFIGVVSFLAAYASASVFLARR